MLIILLSHTYSSDASDQIDPTCSCIFMYLMRVVFMSLLFYGRCETWCRYLNIFFL